MRKRPKSCYKQKNNRSSLHNFRFPQTSFFTKILSQASQQGTIKARGYSNGKQKYKGEQDARQLNHGIEHLALYAPHGRDGSGITERLLPPTNRFLSSPDRIRMTKRRKMKKHDTRADTRYRLPWAGVSVIPWKTKAMLPHCPLSENWNLNIYWNILIRPTS